LNNFRIIEAGGDFGGTWCWNRYPGAQCDIEAYCYLPYSRNSAACRRALRAPEISVLATHCEHVQSLRTACFQTKVTNLRWDEDITRWIVSTDRNDAMSALRGDGDGSAEPAEAAVGARQRRVRRPRSTPVVGTTTTPAAITAAVSADAHRDRHRRNSHSNVPHVSARETLYVFQRTPSSVDLRGNKPTDRE
jgi:cyclohexanone monooxygenase